MTDVPSPLAKYFRSLTPADRARLEERLEQYRPQLEDQGYDAAIAEGEHGLFAGVLVIDRSDGRFGFLEADGSVTWLTGGAGGIGALGSAVAQRPTEALENEVEGLDHTDVE